jgi:hypothetical protein
MNLYHVIATKAVIIENSLPAGVWLLFEIL